jgi:hypothetical protein
VNKPAQWIIGVLISLGAVLLAVRGVNLAEAAQALRHADYRWVAPAVGMVLIGLAARAGSWQAILGPVVPYRQAFAAMNEGYLLNNFLPFRLGEVARAYLVSRSSGLAPSTALSSVLVERLVDMCMVLGMLLLFVPVVVGLNWAREAAAAAVGITAVVLLVLHWVAGHPEWVLGVTRGVLKLAHLDSYLSDFIHGLAPLRNGRIFLRAAVFSALAWLTAGLSNTFLVFAILPGTGWQAGISMGFFALIIGALGVAVPSAPGYVGVFEAAVVAALGVFKVEASTALSYAVLLHFVNFAVPSLLGAAALVREGESLGQVAQAAQALLANRRRDTGAPPSAA